MQKWLWLLLAGLVVVAGLIFWWARQALAPSSEAYRASVLQVLKGQGGLDPGLGFLLRGLKEDLNCRDEALCLRRENFAFALDLAEEYENLFGDYYGRLCQSGRLRPGTDDKTEHERLCQLLERLFKEVGGVKMNAALALQFLDRNDPDAARSLLKRFLDRILEHRERVLAITAELRAITWLEPVLPAVKS